MWMPLGPTKECPMCLKVCLKVSLSSRMQSGPDFSQGVLIWRASTDSYEARMVFIP